MTRFPTRRSLASLAVCGAMFASVACDKVRDPLLNMESATAKANRSVDEGVKASLDSRKYPTTQGLAKGLAALSKAAADNGASYTNKIRSKSLLAQIEYETGDQFIREVDRIAPSISRSLWEIGQLTTQIRANNESIAALNKKNPEASLKAIEDKKTEQSALGAAAGQKSAELQSGIDKLKAQIADLIKQKDAGIAQADTDAEKASKLSGKAANDLMDTVTETRRKAANTGHDIDKLTAALLPLERDLAVEQGKKKTADDAVAALDAEKKNVETEWQGVQAVIAEQKAAITKFGEEIANKAKELDDLNKQTAGLRAKAIEQFSGSAKHYASAADDAKRLASELAAMGSKEKFSNAPEKKAWDQLRKTYDMNTFKLFEAEADNAIGSLLTVQAAQLRARQQLLAAISEPLQTGGVAVPAQIGTGSAIAEELKKTTEDSGASYSKAAETFVGVYDTGSVPKDIQQAAHISRMFSFYGQYLDSDKADKTKLDEARKEFQSAFGDRKEDPIVKSMPEDLRA